MKPLSNDPALVRAYLRALAGIPASHWSPLDLRRLPSLRLQQWRAVLARLKRAP